MIVYRSRGQIVRVAVEGEALTIGRDERNDVCPPGAGLSRQHCRVVRREDGLAIEDLGSSNGTFVNGQRVPSGGAVSIRAGDVVVAGSLELMVDTRPAKGEAAAPPAAPAAAAPAAEDEAEPDEPAVLSGDPARDARNVALLLETIAELHGREEPSSLLPAIVDRVLRLTGAERGLLLIRGQDGLETTVGRTREGRDLANPSDVSKSIPRKVIETGEAVCITGLDGGDDASQSMKAYALRAALGVPIRQPGGVSGVIYVDSQHAAHGFGAQERAFLEALAAQCAVALERAAVRRQEVDERRRLEAENAALRERGVERPLAVSPAMDAVLRRVERVAGSDVTLLITGETGAGKEVLARYAHALSHRRSAPFVVVDCGAIPEALLESVLFGHVKGAFTGAAADSEGLVRRAAGGTLLLDEVGELPLALQPKLLRFLEERTFLPVGSGERQKVDVRLVACTHRDLQAMAAAGTFREDLFFRLNAFPVEVPPLRERRDDVLPLARLLLARERETARAPLLTGFTHDAEAALLAYPWPGNVRELSHRIQRAAVTAMPPFITVSDLDLAAADDGAVGVLPLPAARRAAMDRFEKEYVTELLRRHKGRVQQAAGEAGVSRQMFQRLMARHGIAREAFK